ncbi:hypothetical protein [Microbacterium sp. 1P06AB]|uniref:hypothetical protein n=1 Tax=Microbacterium sp. 1P06AB TaxID=3132289 RepID=UPI0039A49825
MSSTTKSYVATVKSISPASTVALVSAIIGFWSIYLPLGILLAWPAQAIAFILGFIELARRRADKRPAIVAIIVAGVGAMLSIVMLVVMFLNSFNRFYNA